MSKTVNLDIPRTAAEREARLRAPMTISLEEHVARAIFDAAGYRYAWDDGLTDESKASYYAQARAAIAAVRKYGEPANGVCNKCGYCGPVERHGFDQGRHPNCNYAASIVPPSDAASIRESERAACEAIAREGSFPFDIDVWLNATKKEMTVHVALAIADAIAARKGKGEGK